MNRILLSALLALAAAPASATGDAQRGEVVYGRCLACHALAYDRVGPRHCGLFGRRAGSIAGFAYSPAMLRARIVWNRRTLDRFLASPRNMVPGTSMTYDGVADRTERTDLIVYLKQANQSADCASVAK